MKQKHYEMSDEQWEQIKDLFPKAKTGKPVVRLKIIG